MESKVWQRVLGQSQPGADPGLGALLRELLIQEQLYRKWGREELLRRQQESIAIARGIARILGQRVDPHPAPVTATAEQCYHRTARHMAEFAARAAVPEVGLLFQALETKMKEQCVALAKLLGTEGRRGKSGE